MSKKMMKRSLALGALMAFVITGSALANTLETITKDEVNITTDITSDKAYYNATVTGNDKNILAQDNVINITGSVTRKDSFHNVYGNVKTIKATGNEINILSGKITLNGDFSDLYNVRIISNKNTAEASENKINFLDGAEVSAQNIYVAYCEGATTNTSKNEVKFENSEADIRGGIYASYVRASNQGNTSAETAYNKVIIGSTSEGHSTVKAKEGIYGTYARVGNGTDSTSVYENSVIVEFNEVNISGNTTIDQETKGIYGAYVLGEGPGKNVVSANNNKVVISGNVEIGSNTVIYGGYAKSLAMIDGSSSSGIQSDGSYTIEDKEFYGEAEQLQATATGNEVVITGNATVKGKVYGGYASTYDTADSIDANASGNTITVDGNADISTAELSGSYTETIDEKITTTTGKIVFDEDGEIDVDNSSVNSPVENEWENVNTSAENTSNNTLNISKDWTGGESGNKEVKSLGNFDEIVIEEMQYGETALTVTEKLDYKADDPDNENSNGTKITVKRMNMSGDQELSGELEIIKANKSNLKDENNQENGAISDKSSVTIYKGTSEIIDVGFGGEAGMELKEENIKRTTRNDQVLVIGESRAAATAFTNQGSELVETGLDALARDNAKAGDTKAFAAVYGNASEYATGSHVKVNGWSGIVGVGKTNADGLTMGVFFENGTGNYRTYNTVNNDFMRGDGEATYNGGGFLVRKDNANGVYTEASLRAGNLRNELRNAVRGHDGLAGYDVDTFYYGAHVGIGKVIPRGDEGDSIDVYGKFIYTHHSSEDFNIDGSDFHFDSVDSERLRLGFRINEVQSNKLSMYYGAAWEYEFGGDAENTTVGYDLSTPSLGGSTMIGEIGMHYLASEKWSLDLNVRGYSGQRDGFTGSVQANYNF